jgi:hypothetical protein
MKNKVILGCLAAIPMLFHATAAAEVEFRTDINPALLYFQAYQTLPHVSEEDENFLFRDRKTESELEDRHRGLLRQYDNAFKLVRRARFTKASCDWGYDVSDGPEALLPGLAPAKRLALAARLRAGVALEEDNFQKALAEVSSAFVLGRQLTTDRILISCLVQFAIENILTLVPMENYYRLSADELDQLFGAFEAAPRRGTVAETIGATERQAFFGYIERKVNAMVAATHGNEEAFWTGFTKFWNPIATESEGGAGANPTVDSVKQAAGGTSVGLIRLLNEMPPLYVETARVLALPYREYKAEGPLLFGKIANSPNPLVKHFFTVFVNVRPKEFGVIVQMEMLRAAAAYKRGGMKALEAVKDPLTGGAFEFSRVQLDGVDRGFKLKCKEQFRDFDEVAIFIEKPGRPINVVGKKAGTAR